ncbi:MAG: TldD/PmbA family protein [Candidatus Marinimicrobia bacterium]|nr:TldD/PmbA family protein [Candidatus Neomarinimicrobiota bacterium]MBL7059543.1 TldD/PmbA family protein [Candidatus Neomarinimicrobiota bacterium]
MSNNHLQNLLSAIDVPANWVGLREVKEATTTRYVRDGKPQANSKDTTHGIMVEVLAHGQFGYIGTNRMDTAGIAEAAKRAFEQAKLASKYSIAHFTDAVRPKNVGTYRSPFVDSVDAISPGTLNELLVKINAELKVSDKVNSVNSMARIVESDHRFVSSNGSNIHQDFLMVTFDMQSTAQDGLIVQTRSHGGMRGFSHQQGMEVFDEPVILAQARKIGEESVELLTADECPTGTMGLVLAPDQMMLQIHESIGHATEVDRILGDERNYAGWSFVKPGDFGKLKYGSDIMNVTFDPTVSGEFASYNFDDGGLQAKKEYIVQDGILVRGLGGKESQMRSGLPGVANFRASTWNRAPIDRMANLNLEPGDSSFEEIISAIDYGVFMESNRSWSIDDYRNKFQFGCEYGKLIENGKLTKTVRNPNYRGITNPFWNNLKMVGNKDTFEYYGTPYCGKGEPNQTIRVGHASPVAYFENVEVFGGA